MREFNELTTMNMPEDFINKHPSPSYILTSQTGASSWIVPTSTSFNVVSNQSSM